MHTKRTVRFFRQHSMETCGISCILMILDYYRRVQYPTAAQERKLYSLYRCRAFCGTLASAAADCLARNRLEVTVCHSSENYLDNRDGYYPESLYQAILDEYKKTVHATENSVRMETGICQSPDWYRTCLDKEQLLMVQCIVPGDADGIHNETLHWILLYGYENDEFLACDPLSGKIRLTSEELAGYADTPVGHICIAVRENGSETGKG